MSGKGSRPRPYSVSQDTFANNWDAIFKKEPEMAKCGCGRSPTGQCIGWHKLTEDQFKEALLSYNTAAQQLNTKPFVPVDKNKKDK